MSFDLVIGDRYPSSWSLRGWLLFEKFNIEHKLHHVSFIDDRLVEEQMPEFAPAKTVPTVRTPEGVIVGDSLAIAEELASRYPDAGILPKDPAARAVARFLMSEMHSGFGDLRNDCPMNLRVAYSETSPSDEVKKDLARLEKIWAYARKTVGSEGPWLCGEYGAVDAFFAPVAARIAGYGLTVGPDAAAYVKAHLADPAFRRWRAMGMIKGAHLPWYERDYPQVNWPGPTPILATNAEGPSENTLCPYSRLPVTHFLSIDGCVFGFCNEFCRDKTRPDPAAWPAFMGIYQS